ncbi:serine O-acetyltransferase [Pseudomaricurvus hydrocarbonicus]
MYFNAVSTYRVARFFYLKRMKILARFFEAITYLIFNCYLPAKCVIGQGTYCSHRGMGVVIHPDSVIGRNCVIGTGVTLGGAGGDKDGAPVIGDDVYLGTGTKVIGPVNVGKNVITGANSVVVKHVAEGQTVVGIPARPIGENAQSLHEMQINKLM